MGKKREEGGEGSEAYVLVAAQWRRVCRRLG